METAKLERLKLFVQTYLSKELADEIASEPDVRVHSGIDFVLETLALEVRYEIAGNIIDIVDAKYPADWWQAFKEQWFPKWALSRWPVRYKRIQLVARELYPKLTLPDRKDAAINISHHSWTEQP